MTKKTFTWAASLAALLLALFFMLDRGQFAFQRPNALIVPASGVTDRSADSAPTSKVLAADGAANVSLAQSQKTAIAQRPANIAREIMITSVKATDALERIKSSSTLTAADKAYSIAMLAESCSKRSPAMEPNVIDKGDPASVARGKLSERRSGNYCAGMAELKLDEIDALWKQAAQAGDARAIAFVGWQEFAADFTKGTAANPPVDVLAPEKLSSDLAQKVTAAMASQDPTAIGVLGQMLAQTSRNQYFATDTGVALSALPAETWALLACNYGMDCGRDNTVLLSACGREGQCGFASLDDYYRRQVWTPEQAAMFDSAHSFLAKLIETGNASSLSVLTFDSNSTAPRNYREPRPNYRLYR